MTVELNIEETWTTRQESYPSRMFVGLQNSLPQAHEDEQQLFEQMRIRRNEIKHQVEDVNLYMIIHDEGSKMTVAVRVGACEDVPEGMVQLLLPEENYVVFRFQEKQICDFWRYFCDIQNQQKFNLSTGKARFETFNSSLQPNGLTEIYYPTKS